MPPPNLASARQTNAGQPAISGQARIGVGAATVEARAVWHVMFDGPGSDAYQAMNATPEFGATQGNLVLLGKDFELNPEDECAWKITCIYNIPQPGQQAAPAELDEENGSRWAIEFTINPWTVEEEVQKNIAGKMILNKAHDPIAGIMVERNWEELSVSFTTNLVDWIGIDACFGSLGRGCVNSEDVTLTINGQERVFLEGTLRFMNYSLQATLDPSGAIYTRMTYRLKWKPEGWVRKLANKGLNTLVEVVGEPVPAPIRDSEGNIVTTPQYLTADGTGVLAVGTDVNTIDVELLEEWDLGATLLWDLET